MNLTDTHCHLYFDHYDRDRDAVLARAWEAGVRQILVPGIDLATSRAAVELADQYPNIYASVGVHPNSALSWEPGTLSTLAELITHPKTVAVGEIGLDYYRDRAPRSVQERVFREQVSLAGQVELPLVIHTRNRSPEDRACIADVLDILSEMRPDLLDDHPGVIHSFSGDEEEAQRAVALGFYIGITGPVTFKKAHELRRVVATAPKEKLLIETDGPFLTPHPYRGKRNEPAYVYHIAAEIGNTLQQAPKEIANSTYTNAQQLFQWRDAD
jgi:TatD DNase family protein